MNNINAPAGFVQGEQVQRTSSDIKNILPVDLYEGMMRASFLITEIYRSSTTPSERKIEDFVHVFWTTFHFTRLKLNPELSAQIDEWFFKMKLPVPNNPNFPRNTYLMIGIKLYGKFYNELVKLGIGSMFDEPIIPAIALTAELEDESIWEEAPP
ncbi:MAG: hypothetical protein WC489_08385 [Patescibacteria group bacterium]|jgi:hypothetical protein